MLFEDRMELLPATKGKRHLEGGPSAGPDNLIIEGITTSCRIKSL